jgi:hypothetical protein
MYKPKTEFTNEAELFFFSAAIESAHYSWFLIFKTLADCPYCGDLSYLADDNTCTPEHLDDCKLGKMIAAYLSLFV